MKKIIVLLILSFSAIADYEIRSYTIDSGGSESSGGQYAVIGTIGQHDAAVSSGGQYELLGGFWPGQPLCIVDFEHFANFAQYWFDSGTDLPSDLYEDGTVDFYDLDDFVYQWLYYCPYDWPLR